MIIKAIRFSARKLNTFYYRFKYRNTTLKVGRGVSITKGNLIFKSNVLLDQYSYIGGELNGTIEFGDNVKINRAVRLDCSGRLVIGDGTTISEESIVYTHTHGKNPNSMAIGKELIIGRNVWIGARCLISCNVREIPDNTIVPAGTVLRNKDEIDTKCLKYS